jgi:hypothetical protein
MKPPAEPAVDVMGRGLAFFLATFFFFLGLVVAIFPTHLIVIVRTLLARIFWLWWLATTCLSWWLARWLSTVTTFLRTWVFWSASRIVLSVYTLGHDYLP